MFLSTLASFWHLPWPINFCRRHLWVSLESGSSWVYVNPAQTWRSLPALWLSPALLPCHSWLLLPQLGFPVCGDWEWTIDRDIYRAKINQRKESYPFTGEQAFTEWNILFLLHVLIMFPLNLFLLTPLLIWNTTLWFCQDSLCEMNLTYWSTFAGHWVITGLFPVITSSSPFTAAIIMCTGELHKPPKESSCAEAPSSTRCCLSKPLLFSTSVFIFLNHRGDSNKMQNPCKWFSKISDLSALLFTSGLTISGTGSAFALLLDYFWNPRAACQWAWLW